MTVLLRYLSFHNLEHLHVCKNHSTIYQIASQLMYVIPQVVRFSMSTLHYNYSIEVLYVPLLSSAFSLKIHTK